jgi:hypothetical protein
MLEELRRTLQAIAQPEDIQKSLFPDFAFVADELVLEFSEALRITLLTDQEHLSSNQLQALERLDQKIIEFSGDQYLEVWLEKDSLAHPVWDSFRSLALEALSQFGWPNEIPSPGNSIYIGPPTN